MNWSTGVMPLVVALAKAYQERDPAAVVEMGQGLGTKARLQALEEGKINIALASHGLVVEELPAEEWRCTKSPRWLSSLAYTRACP